MSDTKDGQVFLSGTEFVRFALGRCDYPRCGVLIDVYENMQVKTTVFSGSLTPTREAVNQILYSDLLFEWLKEYPDVFRIVEYQRGVFVNGEWKVYNPVVKDEEEDE